MRPDESIEQLQSKANSIAVGFNNHSLKHFHMDHKKKQRVKELKLKRAVPQTNFNAAFKDTPDIQGYHSQLIP